VGKQPVADVKRERKQSGGGFPAERTGTADLHIPKLRKGSSFPAVPEPRRMAEKAVTAVVQEAPSRASPPGRWMT